MKTTIKKLLYICVAILIVFLPFNQIPQFVSATNELPQLNCSTATTSEEIERQLQANIAYTNILNSFRLNCDNAYIAESYMVDGIPSAGFPEYYAGAYIDSDFKLIVLTTELSEDTINEFYSRAQTSDIIVRQAENSYSDLVVCMDEITHLMRCEFGSFLKYAYIDDFHNCIVVGSQETDDEFIDLIYAQMSKPWCVVFSKCNIGDDDFHNEFGEFTVNNTTEFVETDSAYTIPVTSHRFTFGFKAKKLTVNGYQYGFVTAGHAVNLNDYVGCLINSSLYGVGQTRVSINNAYVDSAFVEILNDDCTSSGSFTVESADPPYNEVTRITSTSTVSLCQGADVYKCGLVTKETKGTVISTSFSLNIPGASEYFLDVVITTYDSQDGDSGGLTYSLSTGSNYVFPAGIHKGSISPGLLPFGGVDVSNYYDPVGQYYVTAFKVYSKMSYVLQALGVEIVS